jgi:hypothetical protein
MLTHQAKLHQRKKRVLIGWTAFPLLPCCFSCCRVAEGVERRYEFQMRYGRGRQMLQKALVQARQTSFSIVPRAGHGLKRHDKELHSFAALAGALIT